MVLSFLLYVVVSSWRRVKFANYEWAIVCWQNYYSATMTIIIIISDIKCWRWWRPVITWRVDIYLQGVNCEPVFIAHQYGLNWYYSSRVLIRLNWWPRRGRLLGLYARSTPVPDSAWQFVQVRYGVVAKLAENYEMFAGLSSKKSILQQMKK